MEFLSRYQGPMLSILRIMTSLLFLDEGSAKVFHFPHVRVFDTLVLGTWPEGIAGPLEIIFGVLILLGLFSRIASFLASGEMAVAYFVGHAPRAFHPFVNGGTGAILYCFVFLYLACAGPGPWAINQK